MRSCIIFIGFLAAFFLFPIAADAGCQLGTPSPCIEFEWEWFGTEADISGFAVYYKRQKIADTETCTIPQGTTATSARYMECPRNEAMTAITGTDFTTESKIFTIVAYSTATGERSAPSVPHKVTPQAVYNRVPMLVVP